MGFTTKQWPGINKVATYSEKLLVGYRWYDQAAVTPAFPFGHGLSYTTFNLSELSAASGAVSFTVANTGSVSGAETPQVYLGFPTAAGEPPRQLKGFTKVPACCPTLRSDVPHGQTTGDSLVVLRLYPLAFAPTPTRATPAAVAQLSAAPTLPQGAAQSGREDQAHLPALGARPFDVGRRVDGVGRGQGHFHRHRWHLVARPEGPPGLVHRLKLL